MDSLSGFTVFVRVAETRSIVGAARPSASAPRRWASGSPAWKRNWRAPAPPQHPQHHPDRRRQPVPRAQPAHPGRDRSHRAGAVAKPRDPARAPAGQPAAGQRLVLPTLADFMQAYPDIELDLDFSDRVVDVVDEGFDVVLRTGQPVDSRLSMRELGEFQLKLVGSPASLRPPRHAALPGRPAAAHLPALPLPQYRPPRGMAAARARTAKPRRRSRCRWSATTSRPASASPCATRASPACRTSDPRGAARRAPGQRPRRPSASAARDSSCSGRPAARSRPSCAPSSTSVAPRVIATLG